MGKISNLGFKILFVLVIIISFFVSIYFFSRESGLLNIEADTKVLRKAYPMDYPTDMNNKVIQVLKKGEQIRFINIIYGKDYAAYEVRVNGRRGYIISGGAFSRKK